MRLALAILGVFFAGVVFGFVSAPTLEERVEALEKWRNTFVSNAYDWSVANALETNHPAFVDLKRRVQNNEREINELNTALRALARRESDNP